MKKKSNTLVHTSQDNMLSAARFVAEEEHLPTPQEAGVFYKAVDEGKSVSKMMPESKRLVTFEGAKYECSLKDLTNIIHYLFDLLVIWIKFGLGWVRQQTSKAILCIFRFSTDFQYNLVRSVFTFSPEYKLIDAPFQMLNPKRLFAPLKSKPKKEKSPKKEKPSAKGKKKDIDTEEYLALLEVPND